MGNLGRQITGKYVRLILRNLKIGQSNMGLQGAVFAANR